MCHRESLTVSLPLLLGVLPAPGPQPAHSVSFLSSSRLGLKGSVSLPGEEKFQV